MIKKDIICVFLNLKKSLSILLIFVFLCNITGYYIVFKINQYQIYKEVKRKIKYSVPDDQLIRICISVNDNNTLKWTKENKEFKYQGEMYDVVRSKKDAGLITYYCIHDFKETRLFANLDKQVKNQMNNDSQRKNANSLFKKLVKNLIFQGTNTSILLMIKSCTLCCTEFDHYNSVVLDKISPPPKIARNILLKNVNVF